MKSNKDRVRIITTGGAIDLRAGNTGLVRRSAVSGLMRDARVNCDYIVETLMQKDSRFMNTDDRLRIAAAINAAPESRIIITHGTNTMVETLEVLDTKVDDKTVILTGSFMPAISFRSDASFNLGSALLASRMLMPGVYIVIGGDIFYPGQVEKCLAQNGFAHVLSRRIRA